MRCPSCGTENPEYSRFCGNCSRLLEAQTPSRSSHLSIASLTLTIALILLSIGFVITAYRVERILLDNFDYDWMFGDIYRVDIYSTTIGYLMVFLSLVLIAQALMTLRSRDKLLPSIHKAKLSIVRLLLILAVIVYGIFLSFLFYEDILDFYPGMDISLRLVEYAPKIAWLATVAAILLFTLALRDAERSNP